MLTFLQLLATFYKTTFGKILLHALVEEAIKHAHMQQLRLANTYRTKQWAQVNDIFMCFSEENDETTHLL